MRTTSRFAGLLAAGLLSAAGCQGTGVSNTGSATGTGSSSSTGGSSGIGTGTGGSSNTGTGGSLGGGGSSGTGGSLGAGGGGGGTACMPLPPITRRLWRLSVAQWGAAVQTLLGLPAAPVLPFPAGNEKPYQFFSAVPNVVDQAMQFSMFTATQTALATIDSTVTTKLAPCAGTTPSAQTTCANSFLSSFAQTAYRRPLDSSEVPNLMKVYAQGAMQDYKTGIELAIQAILISPSFVYRTELGAPSTPDANGNYPDTTLTPYEVASQLAFTLLGTLPDAALTSAASNGSLGTTAGITTQINRLLALPAVQANLNNIVLGWFNVAQLFSQDKALSLIAALPTAEQDLPGIKNDLFTATQSFVNSVLWSGSGKVDDLLTSQTVYVNQRLATLYPGVTFSGGTKAPTSDTTFVAGSWPSSQGRSGILTQPGFLWAVSEPDTTSIVHRGLGIHDSVLCQDPLGAAVDLTTPSALSVINCTNPNVAGATPDSACNSEILHSNARMTYQPCKTCHSQMDPYSRVLQNFGPIGDYRTVDEVGSPIDPTVTFVLPSPLAGTMLTGVQNFTQAMVSSGVFDGCSVQQMASYAIGSAIQTYNTCEVNSVRTATDGTIKSLFSNVLLANFVRARAGGTK